MTLTLKETNRRIKSQRKLWKDALKQEKFSDEDSIHLIMSFIEDLDYIRSVGKFKSTQGDDYGRQRQAGTE